MLDLNFVRDNLPRVEEMLRQRGMDPAAVLKDFHEVDTQRRHAITEAETMKARRNKASEEIAKLKKSGQDASAAMAETKELREQIQSREKTAGDLDERLRDILSGIPNFPHDSVPAGEVAIRRGEQVHATDGEIGRVQGLVIDRGSCHVTHVLLQEGHLWGRKDVAVPIGSVASTVGGIRLTIAKHEVQDLPPIDVDHPDRRTAS